jgi:phosphohistidine phosphatase
MKTVLLMRHGKSKRGPEYETDFERPLAKRGRQDAARMGEFLVAQELLPDAIISSSAERARRTAERFADAADYQGQIRYEESLYFGSEDAYLELLWALDDRVSRVLFVGHNPTTEAVIETLSRRYVRMPTAALARIDFDTDLWTELFPVGGRLAWVQLPREL